MSTVNNWYTINNGKPRDDSSFLNRLGLFVFIYRFLMYIICVIMSFALPEGSAYQFFIWCQLLFIWDRNPHADHIELNKILSLVVYPCLRSWSFMVIIKAQYDDLYRSSIFPQQGWPQLPHSHYEKKRGKASHPQDTFKPAWPKGETQLRNSSSGPMRCGVPDYPDQREVHLSRRHRQKRFVIFGGRWPKTELTYK